MKKRIQNFLAAAFIATGLFSVSCGTTTTVVHLPPEPVPAPKPKPKPAPKPKPKPAPPSPAEFRVVNDYDKP